MVHYNLFQCIFFLMMYKTIVHLTINGNLDLKNFEIALSSGFYDCQVQLLQIKYRKTKIDFVM